MRTLLVVLALTAQAALAHEGGGSISGGTRGGGNSCALDFASIGNMVYKRILHNEYFKNKVSLIALKDAIAETSVRVTTEEITDAENVRYEAANYPEQKIILIHESWCKTRADKPNPQLVLHEYLGIAASGLDKGFEVSSKLFLETGLTEVNFRNLLASNGSDATILKIENTTLYPKNIGNESVELYSKLAKTKGESLFRLVVSCDVKRSELNYHKMTSLDENNNKVQYSTTFKFKSVTQCREVFSRALLNDSISDLSLELGLESHSVVSVK